MRVGVSRDYSLAYIDILCDDPTSVYRPLGMMGQPELPIAFKISGLGSYFCPWQIDTNDVLLQAIGHCRQASAFIDEAWLNFIIQLNYLLRTVKRNNTQLGFRRVMKFLKSDELQATLGGLVVELVTFSNNVGGRYRYEKNRYFPRKRDVFSSDVPLDNSELATEEHGETVKGDRSSLNAMGSEESSNPTLHAARDTRNSSTTRPPFGSGAGSLAEFETTRRTTISDCRFSDGPLSVDSLPEKVNKSIFSSHSSEVDLEQNKALDSRESQSTTHSSNQKVYSVPEPTEAHSEPTYLQKLGNYLQNGYTDMTDIDLDQLNCFEDVCDAISSGYLVPGIRVYDSNTQYNFKTLVDSDFPSDDEDENVRSDTGSRNASESNPDHSARIMSTDSRNSFSQKAAEMEKFYKIMDAAEANAAEEEQAQALDASIAANKKAEAENSESKQLAQSPSSLKFMKKILQPRTAEKAKQDNELKPDMEPEPEDIDMTSTPIREDGLSPSSAGHAAAMFLLSNSHNRREIKVDSYEGSAEGTRIMAKRQTIDCLKQDTNPSAYLFPVKAWTIAAEESLANLKANSNQKTGRTGQYNMGEEYSSENRTRTSFIGFSQSAVVCQNATEFIYSGSDAGSNYASVDCESESPQIRFHSLSNTDIFRSSSTIDTSVETESEVRKDSFLSNTKTNTNKSQLVHVSEIDELTSMMVRNGITGVSLAWSLMTHYLELFFFASNVYPSGPSVLIRSGLSSIFFVLSVLDLFATIAICVEYFCIFNTTTCNNHNGIILILCLWPGALLIAPIFGIVTSSLAPSVKFARAYAVWSRLASISNVTMVAIYVKFFSNITVYVAGIIAYMAVSRVIQCVLIDIYIAHAEAIRYTRGWDGLCSSLFVTEDRRRGRTYEDQND